MKLRLPVICFGQKIVHHKIGWLLSIFVVGCLFAGNSFGQEESAGEKQRFRVYGSSELQPKLFGIDLPDGKIQPYAAENVWTIDEAGLGCVARVHVKVGENFVIKLPNGRLVGRTAKEVDPTDRQFEPVSKRELADQIISQRLRGFRVKESDHFVFIYSTSDEFADVTAKVMETMLMGMGRYVRDLGIQPVLPDVPLPVIMFRTKQQFQAFQRMPEEITAYYDTLRNHVILREDSDLARVRVDLARQQLLSTIAHEGAHQILHNIGVQQRLSLWPMWLGEGIPEFMAPTKPGRKFEWKGAGKINDLRMFDLEIFLQNQFVKGFNGDSVKRTVKTRDLNSTGYATAWTMTHYLAKHRKEDFDRYVRYISKMPPLQGMYDPDRRDIPANLVHFQKFFGEDVAEFENDMINKMSKEKYISPVGDYPHFVCTVTVKGVDETRKHASFFHVEALVQQWRATVEEQLTQQERKRAKWELRVFPNRSEANKFIRKWKRSKKN